jgi:hypothetical protein
MAKEASAEPRSALLRFVLSSDAINADAGYRCRGKAGAAALQLAICETGDVLPLETCIRRRAAIAARTRLAAFVRRAASHGGACDLEIVTVSRGRRSRSGFRAGRAARCLQLPPFRLAPDSIRSV